MMIKKSNEMTDAELRKWFRLIRREHGVKQKDIAIETGLSRGTLSLVLSGRLEPSFGVRMRLRQWYDTAVKRYPITD